MLDTITHLKSVTCVKIIWVYLPHCDHIYHISIFFMLLLLLSKRNYNRNKLYQIEQIAENTTTKQLNRCKRHTKIHDSKKHLKNNKYSSVLPHMCTTCVRYKAWAKSSVSCGFLVNGWARYINGFVCGYLWFRQGVLGIECLLE